jgi:hypothetical protein
LRGKGEEKEKRKTKRENGNEETDRRKRMKLSSPYVEYAETIVAQRRPPPWRICCELMIRILKRQTVK